MVTFVFSKLCLAYINISFPSVFNKINSVKKLGSLSFDEEINSHLLAFLAFLAAEVWAVSSMGFPSQLCMSMSCGTKW